MYHVGSGLYFSRTHLGDVQITKKENARDDAKTIFDMTVSKDIWASIVSSVSANGENGFTSMLAKRRIY